MQSVLDPVQVAPAVAPPSTEAARLRARIHAIGPAIREVAAQAERAGVVPDAHVASLRSAGYFRVVKPRAFGGLELGFDTLVDLNIELARYCASTAWVCGLYAAHQWLLAGFPEKAQREVWDADPDACICGSYAPAARAQAVPGGWRVTGRWSFASGCDGASWSVCAAILPADGTRAPQAAFLLIPAADYAIDSDWDVTGLSATGSKTLVLDDVFVPQHRALPFADTVAGQTAGAALHAHNPEFSIPMLCNIPSCLASAAVGAALGALDDYLVMTGQRTTRGAIAGGHSKMAEFPTIQLRVADAAACTDAAREILLRDLKQHRRTVREGRTVDVEQRILARRGQAFAVSLALRAVEALNASTGGQGLARANPIQRAWRDVNAVSRHISMNWDAVGTMYGQLALGLEPRGQY